MYIALAGLFGVNYTFWGHCVHKIYRLGGACVRGRTDKVHLYDAERGVCCMDAIAETRMNTVLQSYSSKTERT